MYGLSPRGRGSQRETRDGRMISRSIPAWAGEPTKSDLVGPVPGVYPRVGGGAVCRSGDGGSACGLSPRGRGSPPRPHAIGAIMGLSPRGRGSPDVTVQQPDDSRSIPAWAGEPRSRLPLLRHDEVYPRVGGGALSSGFRVFPVIGLSPRGRGSRMESGAKITAKGSIPAWAGEPVSGYQSDLYREVYPRVGGGAEAAEQHRE